VSEIRSAFNKASSQYDEYAFLQKEIAARLDAKLEVISSHADVVLDLGAGTGLLSQSLLQRFPNSKIICLDFAQESLKNNPSVGTLSLFKANNINAFMFHIKVFNNIANSFWCNFYG
jgi:malonyl-CoA O-methyltransferase